MLFRSASVVAKPIAVTLPFGLQVRTVDATEAGVRAEVAGSNVTLPTDG